jgi:hypothetical protein
MSNLSKRVAARYTAQDVSVIDISGNPITPEDIAEAIKTFEFQVGEAQEDYESIWVDIHGSFKFRGVEIIWNTSSNSRHNFELNPKDIETGDTLNGIEDSDTEEPFADAYFDGKFRFKELTDAVAKAHHNDITSDIDSAFDVIETKSDYEDDPGWKPSSNYRPPRRFI